ncbi:MAG: hypothetical protein ACR2JE_18065 [Acidobacteriaceae bacterium]
MRRARLLLPLVSGLACLIALAQPARTAERSVSALPAPTEVRLGNSSIPLTGPWKFTPGDSPYANGSPLWASPAFDDAAWSNMDLHTRPVVKDPAYGTAGYLTGWTARGFPHLSGFAWYRLRLHLVNSSERLWLKMPDHTDDSYQVFANGRYIGEFGHFTPGGVDCYRSRPLTFQLPAPDSHGDILLAVRFYMEPFVLVSGSTGDSGGMHQAPIAGMHAQIESIRAQETTGRILSVITSMFVAFLMLIGAAGAFRLWILDRPGSTYLWLALSLVFTAMPTAILLAAFFSYAFTQAGANVLLQSLEVLGLVCWILFWRSWFHLAQNRWLDLLLSALGLAVILTAIFFRFSGHAPAPIILFIVGMRTVCNAALGIMLLVALLQGASKDRTGALVALPPIILLAISLLSGELLTWFHVRTSIFPSAFRSASRMSPWSCWYWLSAPWSHDALSARR